MSRMNELSTILEEMMQCSQNLINCAAEMQKCGKSMLKSAKEIKKAFSGPAPDTKASAPAPAEAPSLPEPAEEKQPEEKTFTFTEIREALADKSRAGFKKEIKDLITRYGADRLSGIDPKDYSALMADVGGLTHE